MVYNNDDFSSQTHWLTFLWFINLSELFKAEIYSSFALEVNIALAGDNKDFSKFKSFV